MKLLVACLQKLCQELPGVRLGIMRGAPHVELATRTERICGVRAIDLAPQPVTVEDRFRELARRDAIPDPEDSLHAGIRPGLLQLQQTAVELVVRPSTGCQHDG